MGVTAHLSSLFSSRAPAASSELRGPWPPDSMRNRVIFWLIFHFHWRPILERWPSSLAIIRHLANFYFMECLGLRRYWIAGRSRCSPKTVAFDGPTHRKRILVTRCRRPRCTLCFPGWSLELDTRGSLPHECKFSVVNQRSGQDQNPLSWLCFHHHLLGDCWASSRDALSASNACGAALTSSAT